MMTENRVEAIGVSEVWMLLWCQSLISVYPELGVGSNDILNYCALFTWAHPRQTLPQERSSGLGVGRMTPSVPSSSAS